MTRKQTLQWLIVRLGAICLVVGLAIGGLLMDWNAWFPRRLPPVDSQPRLTAASDSRPAVVRAIAVLPVDARAACRERLIQNHDSHAEKSSHQRQPQSTEPDSLATIASFDNQTDLTVNFVRDIHPILVNHCQRCHGPSRQEAGLRFDRRATAFTATKSGSIPIVAGDLEHSHLLARVTTSAPNERMPQGSPALAPEEISKLRQWIADGARWPDDLKHWAFVKPRSPQIPQVQERSWPANPIDHFILRRLEDEPLSHAASADPVHLIRRLSLDLIGLPPTPDEVDQFLGDSSPDAFEKLVDRLMSSPHFGEKWAIRWLDLARFADSNGFEFDAVRTMWLYRDWVIESLNRDMPFDQFTVEQIAGDLLPKAVPQQEVATGFIRSSAVAPDITTHRFDMLVDRVNTVGTTWLGLTFSCAQCHDHKFDPLTQKEYYQFYAIFNKSIDEVAGPNYEGATITTESPLNGLLGTTLVLRERTHPERTFLKVRGSPTADGEPVEANVPGFLHPPRCGEEDRLSLACWIIDDENPLTARVTVNRLWESLFGTGLVRTSDDFGLRGDSPSHPELLDWLAIDFQQTGWSVKRTLRRIVMSSTYRQSPKLSDELRERDPQNRLLARGPRFRLDAELIRDLALASSGLLSENLGGPSVFPWQPPGTSERLEYAAFNWNVSPDEDRYRRGMYTHWKRTALYPSFSVFDAPNRTSSCARRIVSTTPIQALVSLNDPVFMEAAVHLGRRMLQASTGSVEQALAFGFRLCVARTPTNDELIMLASLYQKEHHHWTMNLDAAKMLIGGENVIIENPGLGVADWATYAIVANVLLNLDETITKE